jgi:predicted transposase YbfD/YdcC
MLPAGLSRWMLFTVKKTFEAAANAGAHLIVQLKDNQPTLRQQVETVAARETPIGASTTRNGKAHNRAETRTVKVFDAQEAAANTQWQDHVAAIIQVTRTVHSRDAKTGLWATTMSTAFSLSNAPAPASRFADAIRGHWGIENRSRYSRDLTFGEDASRIRVNPGIFARGRSFAYNILRFNQASSIPQDRYYAALAGLAYSRRLAVS